MNAPTNANLFLVPQPTAATAPAACSDHDPRRELVAGSALAAFLILGFGGWALMTRLDAAVVSSGVVRMSGGRQVVQTPSGGVVSAVHVANGDRVRAGQLLIEFTTTDAAAQERSLATRVFGLQAEIARLEAEIRGLAHVDAPDAFAGLKNADQPLARQALALEQAQLDAQRALEGAERAVLHDRGTQVGYQIEGFRQRLSSSMRQSALNREELVAYETLLAKGLTTKPRVLALRRSAASIDGDTGATVAEMARLRTQAGEARLQSVQLKSERANQNAERVRTAQTELASTLPQWRAAAEQLRRTVIRAPFAGTVTALQMPTNGAVLGAGAKLLEIVPNSGTITVESKVSLADASDLKPGQAAKVRMSALRGRLLPPVAGVVERISADSVEDEKTGQAFYTATVRISPAELKRVAHMANVDGGVRAGTPVEVVVATKPRTAFDFLVSPLVSRMAGSFTQQ